jgi:glutathione S-transferase
MKLYYSPGACSLAPHIALREAKLDFEPVRVDIKSKKTADGGDYWQINSKGYVPTLELDNGQRLTEVVAVLQCVGDMKPEAKLAPPPGSFERYRLQEWLGFTSSEIHKSFSPLFNPAASGDVKTYVRTHLAKRLGWLNEHIGAAFLMGGTFTVADCYLFTVVGWSRFTEVDLTPFPNVAAYTKRILERPAVRAALDFEKSHK